MRVALLFGGLEHSLYPEIYQRCLNRVQGLLFIDTPLNRNGEQHWYNENLDSNKVLQTLLVEPDDVGLMISRIEQWKDQYQIEFSINLTEEFLVSGAFCNDYFGWPNPGLVAAHISADKNLQRSLMGDLSPAIYFPTSDVKDVAFPVVVKPRKSHGGQGFTLLNTIADWTSYFNGDEHDVVIEQYVEGIDCSVESIVVDGKVVFQGVTEEISLPPPLDFLEMGYFQPPIHFKEEWLESLKRLASILVERVQFKTGILHAEFRVSQFGGISFIEFAARPPGDSVLGMYQYSTGASIEEQILNAIQYQTVSMPSAKKYVGQHFYLRQPDVIPQWLTQMFKNRNFIRETNSRMSVDEIRQVVETDGIQEVVELKAQEFESNTPLCSSDRKGFAIYQADNKSALEELATKMERELHKKETRYA